MTTTDTPAPHTLTTVAIQTAHQWTFTDRYTGQTRTVTCMAGCTANHATDEGAELYPEDVTCSIDSTSASLPVSEGSKKPEDFDILRYTVLCDPFSPILAQRLPHVCLDIVDGFSIENMGPDELALVIDVLQDRVNALRNTHTQLASIRVEHLTRTADGSR